MIRAAAAFLLAAAMALWIGVASAQTYPVAVVDQLAAGYLAYGGRAALGPVLGPTYQRGAESFLYLPTQRMILQVPIDGGDVVPANAMDWFTEAGKDGWLEAVRGIPPPLEDHTAYASFDQAVAARHVWLTQPEIAAAYDAYGPQGSLRTWGLPTSMPRRYGPFVTQRFQRGAFQLWVDAVPGMPEQGTVVPVLVGDLLQEAGLLPVPPRPRLPSTVSPGQVVERYPGATDMVAITFDMGSIDDGLPGVLDALSSRGLHATFFVTGDFVRHYPWALPRILGLGHEVANHTMTHPDLTELGSAAIAREVDGLDALVTARGAPPPVWFRAPFGSYSSRLLSFLSARGYPHVHWALDLGDWRDDTTVDDVISTGYRIRAGDVVVTHGGLPKTAAAIATVLDSVTAKGLRQVTLSELFRS